MQSDGIFKPLLITFCLALVGYGLMFGCDRHLRSRKGAWELTFASSTRRTCVDGGPALLRHQQGASLRENPSRGLPSDYTLMARVYPSLWETDFF